MDIKTLSPHILQSLNAATFLTLWDHARICQTALPYKNGARIVASQSLQLQQEYKLQAHHTPSWCEACQQGIAQLPLRGETARLKHNHPLLWLYVGVYFGWGI
jgi:hypothetical protein